MTVNDLQNRYFPWLPDHDSAGHDRLPPGIATSQRDAVVRRGNTWHQPSPRTHQIYVTL